MTIFFDDDDFEPLGPERDDAKPGSPAGRNDTGGADLDRIDNDDYLLEAGFAAEAHLGQLVDGDDDGDGNPWTPAGLEDRFYEDMREHLDGAPDPGTREALRGNLDRIWERTRPGIVGREHARRLRKRATVGEGMLARYRELAAANPALAPLVLQEADDTLGRLQGLGTARDAIDERRRMFRTEVRDAVLNRASETDPRGALEAFKSGGYAELFDGDDDDGRKAWEGHLTQAAVTRDDDDAWERERGELENQQMKGLAAVMFRAEREQAIRSGDVSGAKITQAVKSGLIGREEGEQLRQAALARKDELKEEAGRYAEISDTIMRGKALPIRTREWIDPWYREVMKPALELMDPRAREVVDLDIIRRAGRVPEDRIKEIRRGLNGDDPQAVIDSAGWFGRLRDEMPEIVPGLKEWLPHGEYGRAVAIADAIDAGYPAAKIIEELPRPVLTDKFWRRDPSEGDGIELELLDSGGGGETGDGPGGEAEGAGAGADIEAEILVGQAAKDNLGPERRLPEEMRRTLGPHLSGGIENLAELGRAAAELAGPGADIKEYTELSQKAWAAFQKGDVAEGLEKYGLAIATLPALFVPGSKAMREIGKKVGEAADKGIDKFRELNESRQLGKLHDDVLEPRAGDIIGGTGKAVEVRLKGIEKELSKIQVDEGKGTLRPDGSVKFEDNFGMVKIVWKHGVKSAEQPQLQVTKRDVQAFPKVVRNFKQVDPEAAKKAGAEMAPGSHAWAVTRPGADGVKRQVLYVVRNFTHGDKRDHVVTVYAPIAENRFPNSVRKK